MCMRCGLALVERKHELGECPLQVKMRTVQVLSSEKKGKTARGSADHMCKARSWVTFRLAQRHTSACRKLAVRWDKALRQAARHRDMGWIKNDQNGHKTHDQFAMFTVAINRFCSFPDISHQTLEQADQSAKPLRFLVDSLVFQCHYVPEPERPTTELNHL